MTQSTNGVLIIDKPAGLTSHDVVHRVRRIVGQRSVGHLGTLDPMATGVLPLVLGNMTRLAQFYLKSEKSYEGVIRFGFATDTYDAEGEAASTPQELTLSLDRLRQMSAKFHGIIEQMPPPFSAKKIQGVPAYKLARKKKDVVLQPVQVEIKEFELLALDDSQASFRALVASGTYVRSIAHDLGQLAGCGAHLQSLRRTSVAEFTLEDAHTLEDFDGAVKSGELESILVHPRKLLPNMPGVTATDENLTRIRHGQAVNLPELSRAREVKVFYGQRELIAIATRVAGTLFHSKIVLA
ncbi:MAG TPA: tRNA pseudouridine(55) synthase TruB [Terriglobales bacterium]|jgi:tRNA pseudouridine55 synthase|nr:tRNA pseudouridine(55) synthase TruB [Terriglobales bacterium]